MNRYFQSIAGFIILIIQSIISSFKILLISKFRLKIPQTQNTKCIVIANGPSLNSIYEKHKSIFINNDCIVSNKFAESLFFVEIQPLYYVMLDPYMFSKKSIDTNKTFYKLINEVDWKMYLMIPHHFKNEDRLKQLRKNKKIEVVFFNYTYYKGLKNLGFWFYRYNLACPRALTVTNSALFLALNMNYKYIYLVGADQNWFRNIKVDEKNKLLIAVDHFYDGENKIEYKPYYKAGDINNRTVRMSEFLWIHMKNFEGYELTQEYAANRNSYIFNSSIDSYVDAFEKRTIENILLK